MVQDASDAVLRQLCAEITARYGLDVPEQQWPDLGRKLARLADAHGWAAWPACAGWLLNHLDTTAVSAPLLDAITIGETYFFRETAGLDRAVSHIEEQLLTRPGQPVRVWCAGCSNGEEAYTLAAMLHEKFPLLPQEAVELIGTDVNPAAIQRAGLGIYTAWSFRAAPAGFKETYFLKRKDGRFAIGATRGHPGAQLRTRVRFMELNLAASLYPPPELGTRLFDVILCRNVLMYFHPRQIERCLEGLQRCLAGDGILILGATEHFPLKVGKAAPAQSEFSLLPRFPWDVQPQLAPYSPEIEAETPPALHGKAVKDAIDACLGAVEKSTGTAHSHYLRGCLLREQGDPDEAIGAFRRALYLDPEHTASHMALGSLYMDGGQHRLSRRHWETAASLLGKLAPDAVVEDAGDLTAGRLAQMAAAAANRRISR